MGNLFHIDTNGKIVSGNNYGANDVTTSNPNGSIAGSFGDCLYDTSAGIMYKCISKPTGTTWIVV